MNALRATLLALLPLPLATPAVAQHPRAAVQVDVGLATPSRTPTIASDGDLTAILFEQPGEQLWCATSDGRGTVWSPPVRVDDDATGSSKDAGPFGQIASRNLSVANGRIHAVWRDARATGSSSFGDVYHARSLDGGATWSPNVRLATPYPEATSRVRDWALATSGDHVHVAISVEPAGQTEEELYLVSSTDRGASFGPPVAVPTIHGQMVDVNEFALDAEGSSVWVAWLDHRLSTAAFQDLWLRRSTDGGQTFGPEVQVNSSGGGVGDVTEYVQVSVDGSLVLATWNEELTNAVWEELRGAVSTDGGATFGSDFPIGSYDAAATDVDPGRSAIVGGDLVVTWEDDRAGPSDLWVARSTDLGATWTETWIDSVNTTPRLVTAEHDPANPSVAVAYTSIQAGGGEAKLLFSDDAGATWTPVLTTSQSSGDVDDHDAAFNALYGGFTSVFLADDLAGGGQNNVWAGGVRGPSLTPTSLASGGTSSFTLDGWLADGQSRLAWVLGSGALGTLPLPFGDGRDVGLAYDGTLAGTLGDPGTFLVTLDGTGAGATGSFPLAVPPGTTFFATAVSLELGPVTFVELADVRGFTVQ